MQAIETKVIPATNTKATRVRATHPGNAEAITVGVSSFNEIEEAHEHAAYLLLKKLDWEGEYVGGATKAGLAWVCKSGGDSYRAPAPVVEYSEAKEIYEELLKEESK